MILAVDPGVRIGVALFTDDGHEEFREVRDWDSLFGQLYVENGCLFLDHTAPCRIRAIVAEDFVNNPRLGARGGQHNDASEVLGALRVLAEMAPGVTLTRQSPSVLPVAKAWAGYTQKQKHLPDQDSAFVHGRYYFVREGILEPVPLD